MMAENNWCPCKDVPVLIGKWNKCCGCTKTHSYNSWVIQSTRQLSQGCVRVRRHRQFSPDSERWSSVHEYTSAGAHTHRQSDKQTHRHQDRRTDSNTRHKYTDTYSTDQRGDRVSRNTPLLVNYVLSWKTITFQHSKQKLWHFLICCPKNCDIETLPNMGLLGRSVWLQVPYAQIWSWTKIYLGIAPWCHPSWPVILSVNNELLSRINT